MQSNHIKPEVNYREFRIHKLNAPEFSHVRLLLYWPIFGLLFLFLERLQPQRNYYPVYCGLDDIIPFCEWALIPYLFWFVFLIGTLVYTFFVDVPAFRRMMYFVIVTYTITVLIYLFFPTCQNLRPEAFVRNNLLTRFIELFYSFDTNTNVCPSLDWKSILQSISSEMNTVISSVANVAGSTVSAIADVAISLVITFYVLIGWRELSSQSKRALYAYCKESVADRICHISKLAHDTYAKFLSGQCVEVMILGTLIFLSFSVAGIPYAGLTAVLTAAFAFVPYIGGFLSCAFGILFTLLAAPNKALLCLIVYQATQFVENQFIYPHVVGNSVGLSPFWTLLAVLLGGKLFGVLGMIFFIPLMALVSQLLHESIERRLHTRKPELSNVQSNSDENTDISQ